VNQSPQHGIRQNLPQFLLLVLVNAFVGAMVGIERSILPFIAEREFAIASRSAILSFLITFGIVKAISNLVAGSYSDKVGRKKLLVAGWLFGLPVPLLILWAPSWSWIVAANVFLGIQQGFCWSAAVVMKIDLAGPKQRGLAAALNESAGYLAVAAAAYWSASLAVDHGLRPVLFVLGSGFVVLGFLLSLLFVRETHHHVWKERPASPYSLREIFAHASWKNKNLLSFNQAGLVNNMNDGAAWGLFPLFFASLYFSLDQVGALAALYPATWGVTQLATGAISDRVGRKWMIASGMWLQAGALGLMIFKTHIFFETIAVILLGVGTAMVYPTLLAAVGDAAQPEWRASAVGVYRFWRDMGYAIGAIVAGIIADLFGIEHAILLVGLVTFLSGIHVAFVIKEERSRNVPSREGTTGGC